MRGKKAKFIRKLVYQDQSLRQERKYKVTTFGRIMRGIIDKATGKEKVAEHHTFKSVGLRRDYQAIKKMVKENHWSMADMKKEVEQRFAF